MYKKLFFLLLIPSMAISQTQIGQKLEGAGQGDYFGNSVALSDNGNILAIGAPYNAANGLNAGHVQVYENVSGVWTQIGTDIQSEAAGDGSGESVAISGNGNIVAIGAPRNEGNGVDSGHVRIYENVSGVWTQIGDDIDGEVTQDLTGKRVIPFSYENIELWEGGGYFRKNVYRSAYDCLLRRRIGDSSLPVKAIKTAICPICQMSLLKISK